jgi:ureidoacrylate peracid hydrolase
MHASAIPEALLARAGQMLDGGGEIAVDPARLAHVVIDLQNGFVAPGASVEVAVARAVTPNVNRISAAVREAGGLNVFVRFTVDPDEQRYWASMFDRISPQARQMLLAAFRRGADEHALWPGLEVAAGDLVVDKTRFSAFIPGTCELDDILRARGIDTLVVTGTLTNCCCESTVRDAMQLGYKVLFVQDGNATHDDATHNATLGNLASLMFAEVVDTDAVVARVARGLGGDK